MTSGTVLVYGGGAPTDPVAELLNPATETFTALNWAGMPPLPPQNPGSNRKYHQAVILPDKDVASGGLRILIIGGLDDMGNPRADSVECVPVTNVCKPGAITLATPRAQFAAFVLNQDLVVVGGLGPGNVPVANAEIFDARTLAPVATAPAVARSRLTATTLPNLSAVITGGVTADDVATAIEIYQPRRAN
jgi:hypothetical protein